MIEKIFQIVVYQFRRLINHKNLKFLNFAKNLSLERPVNICFIHFVT